MRGGEEEDEEEDEESGGMAANKTRTPHRDVGNYSSPLEYIFKVRGIEKGHPCSPGKVWYGVLVYVSSELTAGFRD